MMHQPGEVDENHNVANMIGRKVLPVEADFNAPDDITAKDIPANLVPKHNGDVFKGALPNMILIAQEAKTYAEKRHKLLTQRQIDESDACTQTLFQGAHFWKYGQFGKGKQKFLACSQDGTLFWNDIDGGKTMSSLKLIHVVAVHKGKHTEVFQRKLCKDISEDLCFSIVTKDRTLDLVAESVRVRDNWVGAIRFAAENMQTRGKISLQPITTSEQERREREMDRQVHDLQSALQQTRAVIEEKNKIVADKEKELHAEREKAVSEVTEKNQELETVKAEVKRLQEEQADLHQKIKKIHHERAASRQIRLGTLTTLQQEVQKMEQAKHDVEVKAEQEKAQMSKVINDSQKLLAKAKDTIHKRQQSKQERIAQVSGLEKEIAELREKNQELRIEAAAAKAAESKAKAYIEKARKLIASIVEPSLLNALASEDSDLDMALAQLESLVEQYMHGKNSTAVVPEKIDPTTTDSVLEEKVAIVEEVKIPRNELLESEVMEQALWQPDHESENCTRCTAEFNLFRRRHHCRKCGKLTCDDCSKARLVIQSSKNTVRVCTACVDSLKSVVNNQPAAAAAAVVTAGEQ